MAVAVASDKALLVVKSQPSPELAGMLRKLLKRELIGGRRSGPGGRSFMAEKRESSRR